MNGRQAWLVHDFEMHQWVLQILEDIDMGSSDMELTAVRPNLTSHKALNSQSRACQNCALARCCTTTCGMTWDETLMQFYLRPKFLERNRLYHTRILINMRTCNPTWYKIVLSSLWVYDGKKLYSIDSTCHSLMAIHLRYTSRHKERGICFQRD
jgi:hypothetical protein